MTAALRQYQGANVKSTAQPPLPQAACANAIMMVATALAPRPADAKPVQPQTNCNSNITTIHRSHNQQNEHIGEQQTATTRRALPSGPQGHVTVVPVGS